MKHLKIAGTAAAATLLLAQPASAAGVWTEEPLPAQPHAAMMQSTASGGGATWAFAVLNDPQKPDLQSLAFRRGAQGWEQVPTPDIGRTSAATVVDRDDAWVVGDGKSMHWDGHEWQAIPMVAPAEYDPQLFGVVSFGADEVWAAGIMPRKDWTDGRNTVQRWNGESWAEVPFPAIGGMVQGIGGIAANDLWVVGTKGGGTPEESWNAGALVHWDGQRWQEHPPLVVPGWNVEFYDVHAVAPDDVWAVGSRWSENEEYPLAAHWDGAEWSTAEMPNEQCRLDDIASGAGSLFAVGFTANSACVLQNDGTTWRPVPVPTGPTGTVPWLNGAAVLDDGQLLVTGSAERADGLRQPFAATYQG
ncbi:hypothetical protein SAMN02982929_06162 [Saccharopolyspora kobensis]|uniref:Uncharacterized protein n=1 Tax=Saccharopolyspora kobensis TaxID=146035 RepID=A0A1H6EBY2_9PSEU|nr:hypothetical protein [Saccharopolyspora kobensis]SEG95310.1 hypothetical protein SAMN02982929_06162 [Saccharopolyspora kobensis]SFD57660.1 hypothetical protein SAMN05216506_105124 [Saccharopolyspora kobensis]